MSEEPIWRWAELCEAVGAVPRKGPAVYGVSIDTRSLEPGDLFVALPGDPGPRFHTQNRSQRDGHAYLADAARRGAAGALVRSTAAVGESDAILDTHLPRIATADTIDALWDLGRAARARLRGPVFAVTGSSGKTTVKTLLSAALACPAAAGSLNNFLGVPLSLARTPASAAAAVYELGTNHPGEIGPLAELARPDVALVLNVMPVHLEYFDDLAALRAEKLSIAEGLPDGGTLVVAQELVPHIPARHRARLSILSYGESPEADLWLDGYEARSRSARICWRRGSARDGGEGKAGTWVSRSEEHELEALEARVPGGGRHRAWSLTATVACLLAAGIDPAPAAQLEDGLIPAGRGRILHAGGVWLVDDSYNANPVSMASALAELARMPGADGSRSYAIIGEMLELGDESPRYHRELLEACRELDGVFCVGAGMRALYEVLPAEQCLGYSEDAAGIELAALAARFEPGDRVLVKGSNRVFWQHDFVSQLSQVLAG